MEGIKEENRFIKNILGIFTDIRVSYEHIKINPSYKSMLLVIMLLTFILAFVSYIDGSMAEILFETAYKLDTTFTMEKANSQALMTIVATIILVPLGLVISTFFYHIPSMIQGKTGFSKTFTVVVYAQVIAMFGSFLTTVIFKLTDQTIIFNPLMFLDANNLSVIVTTLLSYLDIFRIWTFFVLFTGFRIIHDMTKKEAAITTATPLLLGLILNVLIALLLKYFNGLAS